MSIYLQKYFAFLLILIALIGLLPITKQIKQVEQISSYWMLFIGSSVGIIGGLFGIGAGILMIPIFIIVFHMKKNYARALSLAILLPPVSFGAFVKYYQEGAINWTLAFILFFTYFIANYFGAKLGNKTSLPMFKKIYATILIIIALIYLFL